MVAELPREAFDGMPITDFHVRGSDEKKVISLNRGIVCFFLT